MKDLISGGLALALRVDWMQVTYLFGLLLFYRELRRFERERPTFHIADFFVGTDGRADKYALGYVLVLLVMVWAFWYLAVSGNLTEWYATLIVGAFVIGALGKTFSSAAERIKRSHDTAEPGDDTPPCDPPKRGPFNQ